MLLHQIHEAILIAKGHGIEGRFADGCRGVMESQKDRPLAFGKPLSQPTKLPFIKPTPMEAGNMAAQQGQMPAPPGAASRGEHRRHPQNRAHQEGCSSLPARRATGRGNAFQDGSEGCVTTPALVLTEITADQQQQIGDQAVLEGLAQCQVEVGEGRLTTTATTWIGQ